MAPEITRPSDVTEAAKTVPGPISMVRPDSMALGTGSTPGAPLRTMDAEGARYFDGVNTLRHAAWTSFDHRRSFEWKLSFGLWTALAALLAGLATGKAQLKSWPEVVTLTGVGILVVLIHAWWAKGLSRVNDADLQKTYAYEDELRSVLGLTGQTSVGRRIDGVIESMQKRRALDKVWGHATQVGITGLLAAAVIALTWFRTV